MREAKSGKGETDQRVLPVRRSSRRKSQKADPLSGAVGEGLSSTQEDVPVSVGDGIAEQRTREERKKGGTIPPAAPSIPQMVEDGHDIEHGAGVAAEEDMPDLQMFDVSLPPFHALAFLSRLTRVSFTALPRQLLPLETRRPYLRRRARLYQLQR